METLTKEELQAELVGLEQQRTQALAVYYRSEGAVGVVNALIQKMSEKPTEKKD